LFGSDDLFWQALDICCKVLFNKTITLPTFSFFLLPSSFFHKSMPTRNSDDRPYRPKNPRNLSPELYKRLTAEIAAPYRPLRQVVYVACGASGFIGGLVFLAKIASGNQVSSTLPNFALQVGVVALMVFLFRWEQRAEERSPKQK
jgi:Low psii accumulation1 / Rep27